MAANPSSTIIGATVGKHRIVRLVGGGEVSRVFACRGTDAPGDKMVAVKGLRSRAQNVADRLLQEAATVARIESPHVVQVFEVSVYKNMPTIVMELVEGESLAALLEKGPLTTADALELARSICLGLHAAWTHGVAHGDLRPNNVLLPEEDVRQAKVGDFLLAAPIAGYEGAKGSPAYLAPELLQGASPDVQSDLYALGCLLFECISGETPFTGDPAAILSAQASKRAPSLKTRVPGPAGLIDLVDRLLDKDRGRRIKTHAEALTAIARILRGSVVQSLGAAHAPELEPEMIDELPARTTTVAPAAPTPPQRTAAPRPPPPPTPAPPLAPSKPVLAPAPSKPVIAPAPSKPAISLPHKSAAPRPPSTSIAELEIDPRAARDFAAVHDEGVEMTRVADASSLLAQTLELSTGRKGGARPPSKPGVSLADLEEDPRAAAAFAAIHDEGVEMTRVADAAMLSGAARPPAKPAPRAPPRDDLEDLEIDPHDAAAFDAIHDEGVEMTRVADVASLAAAAPRARQPAAVDMLTKMLDDGTPKRAAPGKRSAADIRGATVTPSPPQAGEDDEKTRVASDLVGGKPHSADEVGLLDEPLPPRRPRR